MKFLWRHGERCLSSIQSEKTFNHKERKGYKEEFSRLATGGRMKEGDCGSRKFGRKERKVRKGDNQGTRFISLKDAKAQMSEKNGEASL